MRRFQTAIRYFCLFLALLLTISSTSTYALNFPKGKEDLFIQNNILFYEPSASNTTVEDCSKYLNTTSFAGVTASGNGPSYENAQYIVSKLQEAGYTNAAIAGIMGNLQGEDSIFDPDDVEDQGSGRISPPKTGDMINNVWPGVGNRGYGIVQWTSSDRQKGLDKYASNHGLEINDLAAQTDYMIKELKDYKYAPDNINNLNVENVTFVIYDVYEQPGSSFRTTYKGKYYNNYDPKKIEEISETETPAAYKEFTRRLGYSIAFYESLTGETYSPTTSATPDYAAYYNCISHQQGGGGGGYTYIPCTSSDSYTVWPGQQYNVSDEDLYGMIRMAIAENDEGGLEFELSIMPNIYEKKKREGVLKEGETLQQYLQRVPNKDIYPKEKRNGGWFATFDYYNDTNYRQSDIEIDGVVYRSGVGHYTKEKVEKYLSLADDIIRKGNRRIPPEIIEHDCLDCKSNDIIGIKNNDGVYHSIYSEKEYVQNRANFIANETKIYTRFRVDDSQQYYTFYRFAHYDKNGTPGGDPFGYTESSYSEGQSSSCDTIEDLVKLSQADKQFYNTSSETRAKHFAYLFDGTGYEYTRYNITYEEDGETKTEEVGAVCFNGDCKGGANVISKDTMESNFLKTIKVNVYRGPEPFTNPTETEIHVHKKLEAEFIYIFKLLYQMGFPIDTSLSAFQYRGMAGDERHPTHHSYGSAIDINVYDNPWYKYSCENYNSAKFGTYNSSTNCAWYNESNPKANTQPVQDIFRAFGFNWLGHKIENNNQRRDPMHFTYTQN